MFSSLVHGSVLQIVLVHGSVLQIVPRSLQVCIALFLFVIYHMCFLFTRYCIQPLPTRGLNGFSHSGHLIAFLIRMPQPLLEAKVRARVITIALTSHFRVPAGFTSSSISNVRLSKFVWGNRC